MRPNQILLGSTCLRPVDIADAELICRLRLDDKARQYISATSTNVESQRRWIEAYLDREQTKSEFYFIIESPKGHSRGTVRLYDLNDNSFSWGSWIVQAGSPIYTAIESAFAVYEFGFYSLGFAHCHFEVLKGNRRVVTFHKRFGANIVLEDDSRFYFELTESQYRIAKQRYSKHIAFPQSSSTESMQGNRQPKV